MRVARKIAYNVVISSVSKIFSTALALVSIGFITRYLGKEGFGYYATVLAFFAFFGAISDLGIYSISTREISREGADQEKIMGNIVSLRILSALIVFFLSPLVIWFFPYSPEVKKAIIICAGAYVFSSAYQVLNGIFQKNLAMDRVALAELAGKIIQMGIIILATQLDWGFTWIIASLLFYMMFTSVTVYFLSRKYVKIRPQFDFSYWKKFLKESAPLGGAVFISFIYFKLDTILLSVLKSSAEVGIYSAAYKIVENITFFPSMMMGLIFPIMAQNVGINREKFEDISNKTFKVFVLLVVPLVIGVMFLAEDIINLIGGAGFSESAGVLRLLVLALAFIFFGNFFNSILISSGRQKKLLGILSLAAVFNISANLILIPKFSYWGASFVSVGTELLVVLLTSYYVFRFLNYRPRVEKIMAILFSGAAMSFVFALFRGENFFLVGLGGVVVYVICLWLSETIRAEELTSIISRKGIKEYEEVP